MRDIDDMDVGFFLRALRSGEEGSEARENTPKPRYIDELGLF